MNLEYNDVKLKHDANTEDANKNKAEIVRLNMFSKGWYDVFINENFRLFVFLN